MSRFDEIADHYDETRGGEGRGAEYAEGIDALLPPGGLVLEIGVGTGVVALGLRRLGRTVVGVDLSARMLAHARKRLGPSVARADALNLGIASSSVDHATAVWVIHDVAEPARLFAEAARVLRPGGTFVVSDTQKHRRDDRVGRILAEMTDRLEEHFPPGRPHGMTGQQIIDLAAGAGFRGEIHPVERTWMAPPSYELHSISIRAWSAMRHLDDATFEKVTGPAVEALKALPEQPTEQRAYSEFVILTRLGGSSRKGCHGVQE